MQRLIPFLLLFLVFMQSAFGQSSFDYSVELQPVTVPNLPGLHSYAFGQHNGKWLIIGGRKDGIHARQPFNAFPASQNNTTIYVVDVNAQQFWSSPVTSLPVGIAEQLQSSNMNFYQDEDTLYIAGGYAFSATANDHITFPNLASIQVSSVINAVINGTSMNAFFKQITDSVFAVTGGQLGKIGNTFYLVGGQKFDGRYNPFNNPTFTQVYTHQVRKFSIDNSGTQLSYTNYTAITDPVHLRRRDFNLLPQIFPDGTQGYTISSGVFQLNVDLPFLYPVDISANGYTPITSFNQYLSNYHSAKACLYDSVSNAMHTLFFGGMSRYYYQNNTLIQDDQVPFVKTISRLTRSADSSLQEFQLPVEMPGLKGASAEFIPNNTLPHYPSEIIKLSQVTGDTILIGHIYGGLVSPTLNPFANNLTNTTAADNTIYAVKLIKTAPAGVQQIDGKNPYDISVFPNPFDNEINISFSLEKPVAVEYFITNANGQIMDQGQIDNASAGSHTHVLRLNAVPKQTLFITFVFENRFFVTKKVSKN